MSPAQRQQERPCHAICAPKPPRPRAETSWMKIHGRNWRVGSTPTGATERNDKGIGGSDPAGGREADPLSDPLREGGRPALVTRLASELAAATVRGDLAAARVLNDALARLLEEHRGGIVVDLQAAREGRGR